VCLGTTGVITEITGDLAVVEAGPVTLTASLLTCPEARPGETVLVHSGFVLKILPEEP
jgi:hydrogenase maturation factor